MSILCLVNQLHGISITFLLLQIANSMFILKLSVTTFKTYRMSKAIRVRVEIWPFACGIWCLIAGTRKVIFSVELFTTCQLLRRGWSCYFPITPPVPQPSLSNKLLTGLCLSVLFSLATTSRIN